MAASHISMTASHISMTASDFKEKILLIEEAVKQHYLERFKRHPRSVACSSIISQHLRELTWGRQIMGVTMPAPQEQVKIMKWDDIPRADRSFLIILDDMNNRLSSKGKFKPYIGSKTANKMKKAPLEILEPSSLTDAIKDLMTLIPWITTGEISPLRNLMKKLIEEKTTVSLEDLENVSDKVFSGSVMHRLRDMTSSRSGMINSLVNFSSHVKIITDTAIQFAKSSFDYTLFFQVNMLAINSVLALSEMIKPLHGGNYAAVIECETCTTLVVDNQYL